MAAVPFREALCSTTNHDVDDNVHEELDVTARLRGPGLVKRTPDSHNKDAGVIGPYRLGPKLGEGGMAQVYRAQYRGAAGFERRVCIKRILPHLCQDTEFRSLFTYEAKVAGALCHSNIVQVFDYIEDGNSLSIVMEMVDGIDLKFLIRHLGERGHHTPSGVVAYLAGQLLSGLRYAHSRHVVHRDVSPHNILISKEGEVKLADFGVAKALVAHSTMKGTLKGKVAYMSPEQAKGQLVDHRTDLYSAGLVLYELLTGTRFFPSAPRAQLLSMIENARQPRLAGVDPQIAVVIESLLAPSPHKRFQTAQEALDSLPSWEVMGPVGAAELASIVHALLKGELHQPRAPENKSHSISDTDGDICYAATARLHTPDETAKLDGNARHHRLARPVRPGSPDIPTVTRVRDVNASQSLTIIAPRRGRSSPLRPLLKSSAVQFVVLAGLLALIMGITIGACSQIVIGWRGGSVREVPNSQNEGGVEVIIGGRDVLPEAQLDAEALGDVSETASDRMSPQELIPTVAETNGPVVAHQVLRPTHGSDHEVICRGEVEEHVGSNDEGTNRQREPDAK